MKCYYPTLIFFAALILAFITRFYMLGEAPHGLYLDEAGQGYSAYSLLKTGKDEFGKAYPIVFRSFLDFKTPIYIYLLVPLIPIFGLTKFTVRFPSFFFSMLTFPFLYLLIKKLMPEKIGVHASLFASITTLLLAISPWHVLFGRTNFEVNVSLFFLIAGLYYFYKAIGFKDYENKRHHSPYSLIAAAFLLAIAIPAYHSQRVVAPLMMIALTLRHKKTLLLPSFRRSLFVGTLVGIILLAPTLSVMNTPGFLKRATGLNIFTNETARPAGYIENYGGTFEPLVNSQYFLSTKEFAGLYVSYFSPRNIFILGDSGPRSSFPALATFFLWQTPFYLIGLYQLLKRKELKELRFFTLSLLLISPIPAAVTRDPYSTIRSLIMVIPLLVLITLGIFHTYEYLKKKVKSKTYYHLTILSGCSLLVVYSVAKLWSSIIILNEHYRASYWNYGWQEVSETISTLDPSLPIVVDNARTEPYSQLLFFLQFDPEQYQNENFEVPVDEYYTNMTRNKEKVIGNINTRPINWDVDLKKEQYLVGDALAISDAQIKEHNLEIVRDISYPDWSVAFRIVKNATPK